MATFKICVFKHQQRRTDEKYPVSIRVYWKNKVSYIGTEYYITEHQISQRKGSFEIKDTLIIAELTKRIEIFEKEKIKLGSKIYNYSAKELSAYYENLISKRESEIIDFIKFGREYCDIEKKKKDGKNVLRTITTLNVIEDYKPDGLPIKDVTSKFLIGFQEYLKTERTIKRKNQFGKEVITIKKPCSDITVVDYMTDIRTLFNAALLHYNDEENDTVKIFHYPFRKYKLPTIPESKKRNISKENIIKIFNIGDDELKFERTIFARDIFILSFILIGINLKDLYELNAKDCSNGRITYMRAKTRKRRKDNALLSVKIEPETLRLIEKYKDPTNNHLFNFYKKYSNSQIFVSAVNKGLKKIAEICGIEVELSTYYARHSWATIARNKCKISKSDIDECLNHVNINNRLADVYIERDWSIIDEANRKVIDYVFS
jgi:integrase